MDGTVFDTIVRALNTIYSGASADRAEFARAQEVCEAFKSDPNAYQYGILLAHKNSGHNDFQRHYGLALVEHTVRFRWGWGSSQTGVALSEGAQNELRDKLLALLREGLRDDGTEARFIEEKLAAVISSLIIRMWPSEQWPTLHADLLQLYNSASPLKQQLVLTIFRQLCEEVFHADRDPVAALRSFDITTGLYSIIYPTSDLREKFPNGIRVGNKKRKAIKVWVEEGNEEGWFGRWVGTTRQLVASLSANPVERGSGDYQQALKVLGDCIDTITACVTFVPVTVVQRLGVLSLLAELFPVV
ncbi:karyopherin, partial [Spiromyces aspiralis]